MMKFKGVNFNKNSEFILNYLDEEYRFHSRSDILEEFTVVDDITDNVVAQNTRKFQTVGLVEEDESDKSDTPAGFPRAKIYKIIPSVLDEYLEVKKEQGLNGELRKPGDFVKEEIECFEEKLEQKDVRINNIESENKSLKNRLDKMERMYNAQQKRMEKQSKDIKYLKEHAQSQEDYIRQILAFLEDKSEFEADHT